MGTGTTTKDRIFDVALTLFSEHGYEGTRMEKIASEVGINKASLYFHFKSKEEIFRELFQRILSNYRDKMKNIMAHSKGHPVKQQLIIIYKEYLEYNWNNPMMDFWNRIYYLPPQMMKDEIIQATTETKDTFIHELTEIFLVGIKNQEIKPLEAEYMAKTFYYILLCIDISGDMFHKDQGFNDMDHCFSIFWEGIKGC